MNALSNLAEAPPLNPLTGMVDLVSPRSGMTVILTPDQSTFQTDGSSRLVEKGRSVRFRQSRASVTLEDFAILITKPVYTGQGHPKEVFLEHERAVVSMPGGVQVVDGAQSSASGRKVQPPLPGWDTLAYVKIRKAIADGLIKSPVDALAYEARDGKRREGVLKLLAAAVQGGGLPTTGQMKAADRKAGLPPELAEGGDPTPEPEEEQVTPPAAISDDEIRDEIMAALDEAEGADIGDGLDEPVPGEGVV